MSKYVYRFHNEAYQSTMIFKNLDDMLESIENTFTALEQDGWRMQGMNNADSMWVERPTVIAIKRTVEVVEWAGIKFQRRTDGDGPLYEEMTIEIEKHLLF